MFLAARKRCSLRWPRRSSLPKRLFFEAEAKIWLHFPFLKTIYAYESADPVEALSFPVNGIPMTDFVYPAYFEAFHKAGSVRFDHLRKVKKPFQILSGGYQIIFRNGKWSQVFGSTSQK